MGIVRPWWLFAYLALIFGSLPFTGDALIGLKGGPVIDLILTAGYLAVALATVHRIVLDHRLSDFVAFFVLAALALAAGALMLGLSVQEERVHFLEYAVLAWIVRRALPDWGVVLAFFVCVVVAVGDESVQHILDNRVGDLADVVIDVVAAAFALLYDEAVHGRLRSRKEAQQWNESY